MLTVEIVEPIGTYIFESSRIVSNPYDIPSHKVWKAFLIARQIIPPESAQIIPSLIHLGYEQIGLKKFRKWRLVANMEAWQTI